MIQESRHPDIAKLAALKDNWDGYDGVPMAPQTLKNADALLRALSQRYEVSVCPMSNGAVMLEWIWEGNEYTLEVGSALISGCVESQVIAKADPPEREACAKMMDWQPIETAPKDGTVVLIFDGDDIVVARWWPNYHPEHSWRGTYGDGDAAWNPSHWMSLPEPPK